jgi:peptidoglycan/xylan/chitin deacetylase (PgdA/CDA1 family)
MRELRAANFRTTSPDTAQAMEQNAGRNMVITFDDGYESVFRNALPTLTENRFKAIQFLVVNHIGRWNEWDAPRGEVPEKLMDDVQIREWLAAGQGIGSHTLTHPSLTALSESAAREELRVSKSKLEDRFGVRVEHFSYPYGDWNERLRDWVAEAGYQTACTTNTGVNNRRSHPLSSARISVRYMSRNFRSVFGMIFGWFRPVNDMGLLLSQPGK